MFHYKTNINTYVGINGHILNIIGHRYIYGVWHGDTPVLRESFGKKYEYYVYDSVDDCIILTFKQPHTVQTIRKKIKEFVYAKEHVHKP
jgi:hypothetical protein